MKNKKLIIKLTCIFGMFIMLSMLSGGKCPSGGTGDPSPSTTANLTITIKNYVSGGAGIQCPTTIAGASSRSP